MQQRTLWHGLLMLMVLSLAGAQERASVRKVQPGPNDKSVKEVIASIEAADYGTDIADIQEVTFLDPRDGSDFRLSSSQCADQLVYPVKAQYSIRTASPRQEPVQVRTLYLFCKRPDESWTAAIFSRVRGAVAKKEHE